MSVNFDALREIANLGVRRAAVFMGIGINASQADPPISHVLEGGMQFTVVPENMPVSQKRANAEEFARWVIANGFRELAETFSVFLHQVYSAALVLDREQMPVLEHRRALALFSRKGVSEQLAIASALLDIEAPFSATFESMNQARNCMAHRQGVVGAEDTRDSDSFTLKWRALALTLEDGQDLSLLLAADQPVELKGGQALSLGMVDREKKFAIGEQIFLSRHDLQEFCMAVSVAAEVVATGLAKRAEKKGRLPPMTEAQPAPATV
ncbi:hypothetical protein [Mesorhizobium sp.]|uniref:hypothetical protein n=1 Tax=Mesorhizobium sp. TaxID=1871066 RepID=UPI000FE88428|nr:hypothetical protein [Mesorhizobium sp.]RWM26877.1 MAG: hypothetical protein EOR74_13805 [Mesorhizobium sp.]RWM36250.1 MAG: hypothetical protein EOR75_22425 [Mesorhizobium sp.]TJV50161.1 MAG: hypothetical protein E5Y01_20450 [Mesorhizobium sp.]